MGSQLSETEVKEKEKPVKLEKVAEDTGKLVGKGLRKAWSATKSFGKGVVDTIDNKDNRIDITTCPCCAAPIPLDSNFCGRCGKKLAEK